jgi:hypothetical protein
MLKGSRSIIFRLNASPLNVETLSARIQRLVVGRSASNPPTPELICEAIRACKQLHQEDSKRRNALPIEFKSIGLKRRQPGGPGSALELLAQTLEDPIVHRVSIANTSVLQCLFSTDPRPSTNTALAFLREYVTRPSKTQHVTAEELEMFYIPLRTALIRHELRMAFELVDATAAHRRALPRFVPLASGTLVAMFAASLCVGGLWPLALGAMVGPLCALWLKGARLSRLQWAAHGPNIFQQISRRRELEFCERIVVGWEELVDLNVSNYHLYHSKRERNAEFERMINRELGKRGMRIRQSDEEEKYLEYWQAAGHGFEWVEPDQDPADYICVEAGDRVRVVAAPPPSTARSYDVAKQ